MFNFYFRSICELSQKLRYVKRNDFSLLVTYEPETPIGSSPVKRLVVYVDSDVELYRFVSLGPTLDDIRDFVASDGVGVQLQLEFPDSD